MTRIYERRDYIGQKFGRLTITSEGETIRKNDLNIRIVTVKCDCGANYETKLHSLTNGNIKSCGCLQKDSAKTLCINRNTTHGDSKSKEYNAWQGMLGRCNNPEKANYDKYGGRGISVDPLWESDYTKFLQDMGRAPDDSHDWSVGRQDNNENYCKSNCVWEIWDEQARNRGMQVNNTSGVTGVYVKYRKNYKNFVATWYNFIESKRYTKSFSVLKYGEAEALKLACQARASAINHLNSLGAGYAETHGLPRTTKENK